MRNLVLHVKKQYFEEVKSGEKLFEYRLMTDRWATILCRQYDRIIYCLGYPKLTDKSRILFRKFNGVKIDEVLHPEFGDKKVKVFAIDVSEEWK